MAIVNLNSQDLSRGRKSKVLVYPACLDPKGRDANGDAVTSALVFLSFECG
jgi:hypothetical protein